MKRDELIKSKEYHIAGIQLNLFNQIEGYMQKNNLNQNQLAEKLGVSKGYISQILNGDFDHKISKLVELALACDCIPILSFVNINEYVKNDKEEKAYELFPVIRSQKEEVSSDKKIHISNKVKNLSSVNNYLNSKEVSYEVKKKKP